MHSILRAAAGILLVCLAVSSPAADLPTLLSEATNANRDVRLNAVFNLGSSTEPAALQAVIRAKELGII